MAANPPGPGGSQAPLSLAQLFALIIGSFMALLDSTIVNVAVPNLMAVFGVDSEKIQWVLTAYLLTSGVVVPVTGDLLDRFGYKNLYIASLAVFTIGSAMCALAWNENVLIGARVVQAIGGGAIMPVSMGAAYLLVPRNRIGMALGIFGITISMAPAIGPTLGGYLIDHYSWHTIFTINLPIGVAAILLAMAVLPPLPGRPRRQFDWLGFILVTAGCFALLLALSKGEHWGWTSYAIVMLFTGGLALLLLFAVWESFHPNPVLDLRLLKNPVFSASMAAAVAVTVGMFGAIFLIPIFTQNLQGFSPTRTGMLMLPAALVTGFLMPVSGRLFDRIGAVPLALPGVALLVYTTYLLHHIAIETPFAVLSAILALRGAGMGLCMMTINTAGLNALPKAFVGQATAISTLVRNIAASLGIAYLTHTMSVNTANHAARLTEQVSYASAVAPAALQQARAYLAGAGVAEPAAGALGLMSGLVQRQALARGIADTFITAAIIIALGLPFVFLLSKRRAEAVLAAERVRLAGQPGAPAAPEARPR